MSRDVDNGPNGDVALLMFEYLILDGGGSGSGGGGTGSSSRAAVEYTHYCGKQEAAPTQKRPKIVFLERRVYPIQSNLH